MYAIVWYENVTFGGCVHEQVRLCTDRSVHGNTALTLWPWSWTFTVQHTIYVKCEYFMNQEG